MILASFLEILSSLSGRALQHDPLLQEPWQALAGKQCRIALTGYPPLVITFAAEGCALEFSATSPVDLSIHCSLEEALLALVHAQKYGTLMGSTLHITGDLHTAQRLQQLLALFHPDLLWFLSTLLGPRCAVSLCRHVWEPLKKRWPEAMAPQTPSKEQIQRFVSGIERVRLFLKPSHAPKDR